MHLLEVKDLSKRFAAGKRKTLQAVDHVSFYIETGEIFGIIGESGSGKSTLASLIMNIRKADAGSILFDGIDVTDESQCRKNRKKLSLSRNIIFQDSASALDPFRTVEKIITEPLRIWHMPSRHGTLREEASFQLRTVGLDDSFLERYPMSLSGGERQRVNIARALVTEPKLLIADEPTASLDASVQAQLIDLFLHLRKEHGFTILFIIHDLSMARVLCERIGVMHQGRIVEEALTEKLFTSPVHPYTRKLLSAMPSLSLKEGSR